MLVDLHAHTSASDGELTPEALVAMQVAAGVELAAITDHDTLDGWDALVDAAAIPQSLRLLPGIEISASDGKQEVHVLGLNFDPQHPVIRDAVASQQQRRIERAERIGERLAYLGIPGALAGAQRLAQENVPGRPHFARFLVECGRATSVQDAFRRYLGKSRPAAQVHAWPDMEQAVAWIRDSGGRAVLAHPLAYEVGRSKLRTLLGRFRECGGEAMEVSVPNLYGEQLLGVARLAADHGLLASVGSDFHAPSQLWCRAANLAALPEFLQPVWHDWV